MSTLPRPEGKIIAIYDIVWKVEIGSDGETQVHTRYGGERFQFRIMPAIPRTDGRAEEKMLYNAILRYGTYEAVYACPPAIYANFDLLQLPTKPQYFTTLRTSGGALALRFVDTHDDEGFPFLCFSVRRTVGGDERCVVGWAKRREYDDESVDPENLTRLSRGERERLVRREELDLVRLEAVEEGEVQE